MPNCFHTVLEQKENNGISAFFQKIGTAYAKYYNLKYKNQGNVFQGPFKVIEINKENDLLRISRYIHLNPLDIFEPSWREKEIQDWDKTIKLLGNYSLSSLADYLGFRNSKLITNKGLLSVFFDNSSYTGESRYRDYLKGWKPQELGEIKRLIFD